MKNIILYFSLACGSASSTIDVNTLAPFAGCTYNEQQTCLYVEDNRYAWSKPGCTETGRVYYPLTFDPDTDTQLCMGTGYRQYEVEADWVPGGIMVVVDGEEFSLQEQ
jgi:hypothetical protein